MADVVTQKWTKLTFWLGDGATPEVFTAAVCGMNAKSLKFKADTVETHVPNCDDPDAPAYVETDVIKLSAGFEGSGTFNAATYDVYRQWFESGQAKNARIVLDTNSAGYYSLQCVCDNLEITGSESGGKLTFSISIKSHKKWTWHTGLPA